jgi:hypothetical protein
MTGRTKAALVLLALLLLFPAVLWAEPPEGREVTWKDYRTPLTGVPVLFNEATIIWVDVPEEFLKGRSQVTLVWTVMSRVYSTLDRKQKPTFEFCQPQLRVGQGLASGLYGLPVDPQSGLATLRLEVKTKHLKPGRNRIKAMCNPLVEGVCMGGNCQFVITEMYFQETIAGKAAAAPAPSIAGEDSVRQEEKLKLARQWTENCALKSFLRTLRDRVSSELPQSVQGEADRILNSKDWDKFTEDVSKSLARICSYQTIQSLDASDCEKFSKDEPCLASFHAFLRTLMENEMSLLTMELKKKFPDL